MLEERLGLESPPYIAMDMAPNKPDPEGLLRLADQIAAKHGQSLDTIPSAYIGDTVGDVMTVKNAIKARVGLKMKALAVPPPHVTAAGEARLEAYHRRLIEVGADSVVETTGHLTPAKLLSCFN